jgi:hypothetical protein
MLADTPIGTRARNDTGSRRAVHWSFFNGARRLPLDLFSHVGATSPINTTNWREDVCGLGSANGSADSLELRGGATMCC